MTLSAGNASAPVTRRCSMFDWKELSNLFASCFPHISPKTISYELRTHRRHTRIAESDGRIVGFTILIPQPERNVGWLEQIGIAPQFRGRGLARLLLEDFENSCIVHGFGRAELAVVSENTAAIGLYVSAGYVAIDRPGEKLTFGKDLRPGAQRRNTSAPGKRSWIDRIASRIAYRVLVG